MALQVERQLTITDLIMNKNTVTVEELSKMFNVSLNTIRRDLSELENRGILKRTQGGAILTELNQYVRPHNIRKTEYCKEKELIGRAAAKIIEDNSTIILDTGTTTQQVLPNLGQFQKLTVLTNSLVVSNGLLSYPNIATILSGGILWHSSQALIGLPAEQFFSQFHADKAFLAVGGISVESGLTNPNIYETAVKRKMIEAAKEVIVLVDHHKFGQVSLSPIISITAVHKIITDSETPKDILKKFEKIGIEIIIA